MGYNWRQEQKQLADEARFQSELQARTQEEMQQAGTAGPMAKGQQPGQQGGQQSAQVGQQGGPSAGGHGSAQSGAQAGIMQPQGPVSSYRSSLGSNTPTTPQEMLQTANSMADELLGLPNSFKSSDQRKLKNL
jgi:flagellar biosynthesis/type III secretory pathway protein FliH